MKFNKKMKIVIFSFVLLSLILLTSITKASPAAEIFDSDFDTTVMNKMDEAKIHSSTLSVIKGTEVVFEKGYGDQTDLDLVYPLYSINKVLMGVALLQLKEQGLVNLDTDINYYLPYSIKNPSFPSTAITCKHLLAHRGGLADGANVTASQVLINATVPFPEYIYDLLHVNGSLYDPDYWATEPGENFAYSSLGFQILCYIVELTTGLSIRNYIQTNILDPLSMIDTKISFSDYSASRIATPYLWDPIHSSTPQMVPSDIGQTVDYKTTVEDLSKLLLDLMNGYNYDNSTLLGTTSIDLMFQNQGSGHGLGIWTDWAPAQALEYKGYFGNGPGYSSFMFFDGDIGVVCFINQGAFDIGFTRDISLLDKLVNFYIYIVNTAQGPWTPTPTTYSYLSSILAILSICSFVVLLRKRR
jgi:CubicO group peptidase (beta-lactamase class C family)